MGGGWGGGELEGHGGTKVEVAVGSEMTSWRSGGAVNPSGPRAEPRESNG